MAKKKTATVTVVPKARLIQAEPNPANLLTMAVQQNVDLNKLEKLIDLHERWKASLAREQFNEAMAKFQRIAPNLQKNKQASFAHKDGRGNTSYQYQTLDSIAHEIRGPLSECGLSYGWGQKEEGGKISVWAILRHVAGHELTGEPLSGEADTSGGKAGIQAKASTITYLRRYTLTGILGLSSADRDDDGRAASRVVPQHVDVETLPFIDPKQFNATLKKVASGEATVEKVKEYYTLTGDQEKALKVAEDNAPKK